MYLQPDGVTARLLEVMAAHTRICAYLDIPLQHSSARVLKAMGRSGDAASHLRLLDMIRAVLPDVSLRTTVMAGFPGEDDADIADLEAFLGEAGFDHVGVFPFFAEEGTRAAALSDQVPEPLRLERAQRLRDIADTVGFARAAARVGSLQRVLVEGTDEDGELWGRSGGQAPDVDGITFVDGRAEAGQIVTLRIVDSVGYDLVGEPS
jgi:ribosomal protein S12 methylthiotransferase